MEPMNERKTWGGTWVNFRWVCATGLSEPYPIIVYSVANYYRPHLSHSWANMKFSRSQLSHFLFMYLPYNE